jgi:long-chain acyl-CoA synthetase
MAVNMQDRLLCEQLLYKEKESADKVYLRQPIEGQWHDMTWAEVMKQARQVAMLLFNIGLQPGDKISIFSKNCAEWLIADFGITLAGMINVPLFPNQNQSTLEYILTHAEIKLVFIGKLDMHLRTRSYIPSNLTTINFPYHLDLNTNYSWDDVLKAEPLTEIIFPKPEDIYTIIYSSGTTGSPKGVVFTHQSISQYLSTLQNDLNRFVSLDARQHLLSYLPLAHVYERSTVQLGSILMDSDVSFVESLDKFSKNLQEVQPTLFTAVPRIWAVFKQRIEQQIAKKGIGWMFKIPLLSSIAQYKVKKQLGLARCVVCVSGAAHLPEAILKFFKKMGIYIQEGSGQTEDFGYTSLTERNDIRPGYVGIPRFGVEVRQSEAGELLVHTPCLMSAYYKEPQLTKDVLTEDGWLKTGDLVEIDGQNRIKILGRISENFKNQTGEFVSPSLIEDQFMTHDLIEYCCLVGKMLPSNLLLVNLTAEAKRLTETEIKDALRKVQHDVNRRLKNHEKISHMLVIKELWSITNNCLTPTMKIRRRVIESMYQDMILDTINQPAGVAWE